MTANAPGMAAVVAPPPLRPTPLNIVTASPRQPRDGQGDYDDRWQAGIFYRPSLNYEGRTYDICSTASAMPTGVNNVPGQQVWMPVVVEVDMTCSAFGWQSIDWRGELTRLMDLATPKALETELWTGRSAKLVGSDNLWLASPHAVDVTGGAAVSMKRGYELLEEALGDSGVGAQGMIHARRGAVPTFVNIRRDGNLLYTVLDTIVVPGVGYKGTGPDGNAPAAGTTWMYATGLTDVRIDDQIVFDADTQTPTVNRDNNSVTLRAQRIALVSWDGQQHFAVHVTYDT